MSPKEIGDSHRWSQWSNMSHRKNRVISSKLYDVRDPVINFPFGDGSGHPFRMIMGVIHEIGVLPRYSKIRVSHENCQRIVNHISIIPPTNHHSIAMKYHQNSMMNIRKLIYHMKYHQILETTMFFQHLFPRCSVLLETSRSGLDASCRCNGSRDWPLSPTPCRWHGRHGRHGGVSTMDFKGGWRIIS